MKKVFDGLSAGLMIAIGCSVFLACENKYIGACLFSVALLTICIKNYSLYTGKIGYIVQNHTKEDFSVLLLGLLGNTIAVILFGLAIGYAVPNLNQTATTLCLNKLANQTFWQTFIRAIMCGILMYVAVSVYKEHKSVLGIIFAIPVFILCGFEHSIADIGYFAIAHIYSAKAFGFIYTVILGNTVGSFILPLLKKLGNIHFKKKDINKTNN